MKLWLLRPFDDAPEWEPWYDKVFGFVVRAETEVQARQMVEGGNEVKKEWGDEDLEIVDNPWLDPARSTCECLTEDGPAGIIITDFHSA